MCTHFGPPDFEYRWTNCSTMFCGKVTVNIAIGQWQQPLECKMHALSFWYRPNYPWRIEAIEWGCWPTRIEWMPEWRYCRMLGRMSAVLSSRQFGNSGRFPLGRASCLLAMPLWCCCLAKCPMNSDQSIQESEWGHYRPIQKRIAQVPAKMWII